MGNHLSFLLYHHNGSGSSYTVEQYKSASRELSSAVLDNGTIKLHGVNYVFNSEPIKDVAWLKGKLSVDEYVAAIVATHQACKDTNQIYKELTCAACDMILNGVRKNIDKTIADLNNKYAAKGVKFAVSVDGDHLDEHKDANYNIKTTLHITIA